eukprot:6184906-Pleurochrysis_carterae.AAC.1
MAARQPRRVSRLVIDAEFKEQLQEVVARRTGQSNGSRRKKVVNHSTQAELNALRAQSKVSGIDGNYRQRLATLFGTTEPSSGDSGVSSTIPHNTSNSSREASSSSQPSLADENKNGIKFHSEEEVELHAASRSSSHEDVADDPHAPAGHGSFPQSARELALERAILERERVRELGEVRERCSKPAHSSTYGSGLKVHAN